MDDAELTRNDILALDRNWMAAERTLLAWLRTSLALIGFGFTIYKFLQLVQEQSPVPVLRPNAPRNVGIMLIGMGTIALISACIQHWRYVAKLRPDRPYKPWGPAFLSACFLSFLGIVLLVSIIVRSGPLG